MRTKTYLSAALAILAMGSCKNLTIPEPDSQDIITFSATLTPAEAEEKTGSKTTRLDSRGKTATLLSWVEPMATPATKGCVVSEVGEKFLVKGYAFQGEDGWNGFPNATLLFTDMAIKKNGVWEPEGKTVWPDNGNALRVYALAPYNAAAVEGGSGETPSYSFVVDSKTETQTDLLEGCSDDYTEKADNMAVSFRHVLAGVRVTTRDFSVGGAVQKIVLAGVNSFGKKDFGKDGWYEQGQPDTYSVTVSADVPALGQMQEYEENATFLVIPQQCPDKAELKVFFNTNGNDYVFTYPLKGTELKAGTVTSFVISFDPDAFASGITLSSCEPFNTAGKETKSVILKSFQADEQGIRRNKPWKILGYSIDGGTSWQTTSPQWLTISKLAGVGSINGETIEVTVAEREMKTRAVFVPSEYREKDINEKLRQKEEVGTEENPIDLSMQDCYGVASPTRNTANCYIVREPGWYKIPLIYGNAIKRGATNTGAFYKHGASVALEDSWREEFGISSSPYIKKHAEAVGKSLTKARVLWTDSKYDVKIMPFLADADTECPYIVFHIPAGEIEQANVLIGVEDSDGNVAWSWHVWITGEDVMPKTAVRDTLSVTLLSSQLGWNGWGYQESLSYAEERECLVKFAQTGTTDSRTAILRVFCPRITGVTNNKDTRAASIAFYQWGRKDPITSLPDAESLIFSTDEATQSDLHANPTAWYSGRTVASHFWNMNTEKDIVKSIYDPCPAGWRVPNKGFDRVFLMADMNMNTYILARPYLAQEFNNGWYFQCSTNDRHGTYVPAVGLRGKSYTYIGERASYWTNAYGNGKFLTTTLINDGRLSHVVVKTTSTSESASMIWPEME